MKRHLSLALLALLLQSSLGCFSVWAASKDAETRKVLDNTAAQISKSGGISLQFTATSLLGKTTQGSSSGSMDISGKKFYMQTADMKTWFDGKTQWTLQSTPVLGSPSSTSMEEVSMTEPTGAELQAINPYAFLEIYKRGFNYKMKRGKLTNGAEGYKIYLTADNAKQEIREIYLEVDNRYYPVRISMRQGKNQWMRIVINRFVTGKTFEQGHFTFPKDKYPNAEVIDLR